MIFHKRYYVMSLLISVMLCACATQKTQTEASGYSHYMDVGNKLANATQVESANFFYDKAHQQEPNKTAPLYSMAKLAFQQRDYQQAEHYYQLILQTHPKDPKAHLGLLDVAILQGQPKKAIQQVAYFEDSESHNPEIKNAIAVLLDASGAHWSAHQCYRYLLSLPNRTAEDKAKIRFNYAFSLLLSGQYAQATSEYQQCLAEPSYSEHAQSKLSLIAQLQKEPKLNQTEQLENLRPNYFSKKALLISIDDVQRLRHQCQNKAG